MRARPWLTSVTPMSSAVLVAAVRRGLRKEFSVASSPVVPNGL